MTEIRRQTVLVTGAAKRIGAIIAQDLAAHGWSVAVHYNHSREEAETIVRKIELQGRRATAIHADLSHETDVTTLIPRVNEALGPLSALVNNASLFEKDEVTTATRESWDAHMMVNLRAPFVLSQHFVDQLEPDRDGAIVNVIDQRVWNLQPGFTSYTVSKAGLWTLTQTMALSLAPRIRVNGVGPGPTMPNERQTDQHFKAQWQSVPLARQTQPKEVADCVRFLLETPSITGQMICLDGGEHLGYAQPGQGFVAVE